MQNNKEDSFSGVMSRRELRDAYEADIKEIKEEKNNAPLVINTQGNDLDIDAIVRDMTYQMRDMSKYFEDFEKAVKEAAEKAVNIIKEYEKDEKSGIGKLEIRNRKFQNAMLEALNNKGIKPAQMAFIQDCLDKNIRVIIDGNYDKNELVSNLVKTDLTTQVAEALNKQYYKEGQDPNVYGTFGKDASGIDGKDKTKETTKEKSKGEQKETVTYTKSRNGYHIDEEHEDRVR